MKREMSVHEFQMVCLGWFKLDSTFIQSIVENEQRKPYTNSHLRGEEV